MHHLFISPRAIGTNIKISICVFSLFLVTALSFYHTIMLISTFFLPSSASSDDTDSQMYRSFTIPLELPKMLAEGIRKNVLSGKIPTARIPSQRKKVFLKRYSVIKSRYQNRIVYTQAVIKTEGRDNLPLLPLLSSRIKLLEIQLF